MRRCVASTCPDSSLKRMYLPRRPTSVMSELRSWRSKPGRDTPGAMRLRLSSAATMRRPTTTGDKARTTCSTSGSSGISSFTQRHKEEFRLVPLCLPLCPLCEMSLFFLAIDYGFDLLLDLVHQRLFTRFDVQTQQWFRVRAA